MAIPYCSSISSDVDEKCLMQVDNGFSKKDPSKTRQLLFPSLQIKPYVLRHRSGKNRSS